MKSVYTELSFTHLVTIHHWEKFYFWYDRRRMEWSCKIITHETLSANEAHSFEIITHETLLVDSSSFQSRFNSPT